MPSQEEKEAQGPRRILLRRAHVTSERRRGAERNVSQAEH